MSEPREISGLWWLPSDPNDKWVGTLALAPDESPKLCTTVAKGHNFQVEKWPDVLHGCDQQGYPITLLYPCCPSANSSAVLSHHAWSAGYAILGLELPGAEAFVVNELNVSLQHLFEWVQVTGFQSPSTGQFDFGIQYRRPEELSFPLDGERTVGFGFTCSYRTEHQKREVSEDVAICFKSSKGFSFTDYNNLTGSIRRLLHFAVLKQIYTLKTTAFKEGYGVQHQAQLFKHTIEVCSSSNRAPTEREVFPDHWIFLFADVRANFGEFYAKWLAYLKKFDEALSCYFTTIYHPLPGEVAHLCLTQAFEAYHGIKFNSHKERSFEDKIRELAETHKAQLTGLIDDTAVFATTVLHNRNYYTHHNPRWKTDGRVVSGAKLYRLNEKLRLLFQMCVLADVGIPAERFKRLRHQLASRYVDYF